MNQPTLIPAEVIAASESPPPARGDWYVILYLTHSGRWTMFRDGRSLTWYATEDIAREVAYTRRLRYARVVRIPGEGLHAQ